jgi:hypothetical protein
MLSVGEESTVALLRQKSAIVSVGQVSTMLPVG